ncbi:MAG: RNA polymerase sigma factor, partial [Planctomycetia bacterium]
MPQPVHDDELLRLLRSWYAGDTSALKTLVLAVSPWVREDAGSILRGRADAVADAEDLAQAALVNFLQYGPRFQPANAAQLRALLRRIVRNLLVDQARREQHRAAPSDDLSASGRDMLGSCSSTRTSLDPERAAARNEEREWVRLGLQFLDEEERYLLVASEVEGLPWKDIAAKLGMERGESARMRAARLKPRLANILRQLHAGRTPDEA